MLEFGAGVGDHTEFFLDRGCAVTSTDGRIECVEAISSRFPGHSVRVLDANEPAPPELLPHEIVYAYGILYHLKEPALALQTMSALCSDMLLLETCVSFGKDAEIIVADEADDPTQALDGLGCRPTRGWIWERLEELFPFVYMTATQPWHEEFPIDWTGKIPSQALYSRAIFVASRQKIDNALLLPHLLDHQTRRW